VAAIITAADDALEMAGIMSLGPGVDPRSVSVTTDKFVPRPALFLLPTFGKERVQSRGIAAASGEWITLNEVYDVLAMGAALE
jgi:hypothetical protein